MNDQTFSLHPFPSNDSLPELKITGNINRQGNQLAIHYTLAGDLKQVAIAHPSIPTRKHELWSQTCFEFFIGIKDSNRYWEFNLSPAGHWNIYRFDSYRQGMQEETSFTTLPFNVERFEDSLAIALDVDLDRIVPLDCTLNVAITTVIKNLNNEVTYWALTHKGAEADFHLRDSFIIELQGVSQK